MNIRTVFIICLFAGLALAPAASAMDRWAALSMIESGNDDRAVGADGEVSRFQIQQKLWPGGNPQDPRLALAVAQEIMRPRLAAFERIHHRTATDIEFYVLWNAPWQVDHPNPAVMERAGRFANLVRLDRR